MKRWITILYKKVSQNNIRNELYKAKLLTAHKGVKSQIYNLINLDDIYGSIFVLLKYIDIDTLVWEWNSKLLIDNKGHGIELLTLGDSWKSGVWCNPKYSELFNNQDKNHNIFGFNNAIKENCYEYNKINYYESINIIIGNKLFQPLKQIVFNSKKSTIILIMKFIDNAHKENFFKKEYEVATFKGITDVDFYLICNIDIIMDFEEKVLDKINNYNWIIDDKKDYIYNCLRDKVLNKFLNKNISIKTTRQYINEFENIYGRLRD